MLLNSKGLKLPFKLSFMQCQKGSREISNPPKRKRKLEHRWGPHVYGNNFGKEMNNCEEVSLEMHDELKKLQAITTLS